ncbi:retron system putative HNH endonuclease [Kordia jejudonensis]|uniref:retron system putative HNH endonuclease n=1 Tax=Kordia jejudonensis TaxID=1348245 RepID=UPI00069B138D|nr:retron system putative HNH endonuclease [Kordia jejudonensis]
MIFIDRNSVDVPDVLVDENGKAKKELDAAIAHFTGPNKHKTYDKFKVYRSPTVKAALIEMSHGKCVYCESTFLKTYVGDIEHFRPKGEIEELKPTGNSKPGYYWLAADWNNLLLSCRNCNQKSKQRTENNAALRSMGKMNQFPLLDEAHRARTHTDDLQKEEEVRLLINPAVENPEDYFKYDINSGVMQPKTSEQLIQERAKASIKVFALQRVKLVHSREKKAIEISAQMQTVENALRTMNQFYNAADESTHHLKENLKFQLKRLKQFLGKKEENLALARQMIGKFMKTNFNKDIRASG